MADAHARTPLRSFEVNHRSVLAIAWPMTLAYMSTPILGLVDTAVVGQLDSAALLGGLAVGAILFDIVFTTFNFLRASTTGLVAQAHGAGDIAEQRAIFYRSGIVSAVGGILVLATAPLLLWLGLHFMDVTAAVESAVRDYFSIRIIAAPLTLMNYSILGLYLGLGRAQTGLILQILLNGINIVLSIWLGLYLGWGLEGVAWATVVAEAVTVLVGLLLTGKIWTSPTPLATRLKNKAAWLKMFGLNRDIMIRSFLLLFAFAFFTAQGARYGEVTLAANAVLMNFFMVSGFFLDGFATAAETLVGRAVGARYRPAFNRSVRLTLFWGFVLAGIATVVFFLAGPLLIDTLTVNEPVRAEARVYLPWAALTALAGVVAFQMDGVYIGATWSRDMRNMMILSIGVYFLTWWIATPWLGNHGLWLALEVFLGFRGITLYARLSTKAQSTFSEQS